jgi:hypothetical protein
MNLRPALPLVTILPLFGCDRDSGPHFAQQAQSWAGSNVVVGGQHEWIVTATALYFPGRAMLVEGILTGGPPGQDVTFEVLLEQPATSTALVLPLVSWEDPVLGTVGAALLRDARARWPRALAKSKVAIAIHSD